MKASNQKSIHQSKQYQSTFEREMADADFREKFEAEYREFALSEVILQLMEEEQVSVRELAKNAGISPSVIQDIRSGNRSNITLHSICKILKALGSRMVVQIGDQYMPLQE